MLLLHDNSVALSLKIIFQNILATSTYPDMWKLENVTLIFNKGDKRFIKNYRPTSILQFMVTFLKTLSPIIQTILLPTINQVFAQAIPHLTNYYIVLTKIHKAFEDSKSLEVNAVFLDIFKAFDKVWHDGWIFKLNQNRGFG